MLTIAERFGLATDDAPPQNSFYYRPFGGAEPRAMTVWEGEEVVLLTDPQDPVGEAVAASILAACDRAYGWYELVTGREPLTTGFEGRDPIAFVETWAGTAALGLVGSNGIEVQPRYAEALRDAVRAGEFDRLPLYEMGRNFWFYSDQLGGLSDSGMANGFATANQFLAADHAGLALRAGPPGGIGWSLSLADTESLLALYLADEDASWELLGGHGYDPIAVDGLWFGATRGNLAGAFFHRIAEDHGTGGYAAFWREMGLLGAADTLEEIKGNFLAAARAATGEDYGWLFKDAAVPVPEDAIPATIGNDDTPPVTQPPVTQPPPATGPVFTVNGAQVAGTTYSGPVSYLQSQYLGSGAGEVVIGTERNDFINLLDGTDAANGGAGDDVIDGGLSSNFLTGGGGRDVFFLDGRGGVTWGTITDWQAGEELSLWGWRPGVSKTQWVDRAGAAGFEGVTMHNDLDGNGTIDASVTWSGRTRADLPQPTEHTDLLWFHP